VIIVPGSEKILEFHYKLTIRTTSLKITLLYLDTMKRGCGLSSGISFNTVSYNFKWYDKWFKVFSKS
jgi:hypothetical protein